jgi:hypothetical protein
LLNDGHGNFSRVEPGAYPEAYHEPCQNWATLSTQETRAIPSAPESTTDFCLKAQCLEGVRSTAGSVREPSFTLAFSRSALPHAGRAPPRYAPRS